MTGLYSQHDLCSRHRNCDYTLFFFIRMLFLRPRLYILIFLLILDWKYSCAIQLNYSLWHFRLRIYWGFNYSKCRFFRFVGRFCRSENETSWKHINALYLSFWTHKLYPFQNLSLGFILKIVLKIQYPVTAHAPNFDFWTGCREIKRCEERRRILKNPFASRLAGFNTSLKLLRIIDQWYIVPVKFRSCGRELREAECFPTTR